jgi:hypothetical protein
MASTGTIIAGVILLILGGLAVAWAVSQATGCNQYNNLFQQDTYNQCLSDAHLAEDAGGVFVLLGIILIPVGAAIGGSKQAPPLQHTIYFNPPPPTVVSSEPWGAWKAAPPPPQSLPSSGSGAFCHWCGKPKVAGAPFCPSCGKRVEG